jgi:hypothetical protein
MWCAACVSETKQRTFFCGGAKDEVWQLMAGNQTHPFVFTSGILLIAPFLIYTHVQIKGNFLKMISDSRDELKSQEGRGGDLSW